MKRESNLFEKIIHKQNILTAHKNAKRGKSKYAEVIKFEKNLSQSVDNIHNILKNKAYKIADYKVDTRTERGKERIIFKLPYNPDRVIHHALLQVVEPVLAKTYIKDTYQSIKGRGVHKAKDRIKSFLKDKENTKYCLKIDIKKYYPSVDNEILKMLIRRKIKCKETLELIDAIVDSTKGLPIGNYTSQTFGNFYLSYFDHFIKETLKVSYYVRYADDMVFFASSKEELHDIKNKTEAYLRDELRLTLKENWQVFPTRVRGLDFLGFRFFDGFILLRKSIKKAYVKLVRKINYGGVKLKVMQSFMSYWGWLKSTDSYNLIRKTFTKIVVMNIKKISSRRFYVVEKTQINKSGNYQPTLLNFI